MNPDAPKADLTAAARLLVEWMSDQQMNPLDLGYPLDLWLAVTGHTTDPDHEDYEAGLEEALSQAYLLADPPPEPTFTVTDVEVVRGEVL